MLAGGFLLTAAVPRIWSTQDLLSNRPRVALRQSDKQRIDILKENECHGDGMCGKTRTRNFRSRRLQSGTEARVQSAST
jgi:hypothetical protein